MERSSLRFPIHCPYHREGGGATEPSDLDAPEWLIPWFFQFLEPFGTNLFLLNYLEHSLLLASNLIEKTGNKEGQVKVFWSWQSDTPGRIGRHLVREALEETINQIKAELTIEEPGRDELHLDHDRKGIPGSPDLAPAILKKIRESSIFVADVTPVGKSDNGRALLNPNVAIELGYALTHVGVRTFETELRGRMIDLESFENLGRFVDWRRLIDRLNP